MGVSYFSRSLKKEGLVNLYIRYRRNKIAITILSGFKIDVMFWNERKGDIGLRKNLEITDQIKNSLRKLQMDMLQLRQQIETADSNAPAGLGKDELLDIINAFHGVTKTDMLSYCRQVVNDMKSGERRRKGNELFARETIKSWNTFANCLEHFLDYYRERKGKVLTWNSCDKDTPVIFVQFLEYCGYNAKTKDKLIKNFKAFVRYAKSQGIHSNIEWIEYLVGYDSKVIRRESTTKVFLTVQEIQALYDMELEHGSMEDRIRDVFLVGCYTCQRVSDYNGLKRENFATTRRGTKIVRITQKKTDQTVAIPILNNNLQTIAEKYDYNLPDVCEQVLNKYIKRLLKRLSATVPSLAEEYRTTIVKAGSDAEKAGRMSFKRDSDGNILRPKYELVSSHTARRTGITNLYLSGKFSVRQMMSISGHKTERVFFDYVRLTEEDKADEIAKIADNEQGHNEDLF